MVDQEFTLNKWISCHSIPSATLTFSTQYCAMLLNLLSSQVYDVH